MRIFNSRFQRFTGILATLTLILTTVSCGSFNAASYNDGIYGDTDSNTEKTEETQETSYEDNSGSYYQALFAEKAQLYGQGQSQDSVFTDIDNYSSQSYDQSNPDYTSNYGGGDSGFGENPSEVVVNYYGNGWNNGFGFGGFGYGYGWNRGFGWNNGFGFNRGFGGYGYGWNYGYGFNGYGWNYGFGGFGFGGFGFNYGWGNYYYNRGFNRNQLAFVNGNRGYYGRNSRAVTSSANNRSTARRNVGRSSNSVNSARATRATNSRSSSRNNTGVSRRSSSRSNNSRATGNSSSRSRSSSTRSSSSRSRSSSTRSSSSRSSRSSSFGRSSGGSRSSSRSSGRRR